MRNAVLHQRLLRGIAVETRVAVLITEGEAEVVERAGSKRALQAEAQGGDVVELKLVGILRPNLGRFQIAQALAVHQYVQPYAAVDARKIIIDAKGTRDEISRQRGPLVAVVDREARGQRSTRQGGIEV